MSPRLFITLLVSAILSAGAAITTFVTYNHWSPGTITGAKAVPELASKTGDVASLVISQGGKTLTLDRKGDGWAIKERDGFPAKGDAARALIVRLSQAQLIEKKTRNPERYTLLQLEDPASKTAKSRQVRLLDSNGKSIGDVIVGSKRAGAFGIHKTGTYIRLPDSPQTWLTDAEIDLAGDVSDWIQRTVFTIDDKAIAKVALQAPGEPTLTIARKGGNEGDFTIADIPDGQKLKSDTAPGAVARALADVEIDDVRKQTSSPDGPKVSSVVLTAKDGMVVTFRLRSDADAQWLSIEASGSGDAEAKAKAINTRVEGWEFKLPSWRAKTIFKAPSEFFETS